MNPTLAAANSLFASGEPVQPTSPYAATVSPDVREVERNLDRCMQFAANVAIETAADTQALQIHPEWLQAFEDAMPVTATPEELMDLLLSAPTPYTKGLIAGICATRIEMAAISGRL